MWTVNLIGRARKNCKKAPKDIQEIFQVLLAEIKIGGPIKNQWPNYGKITGKKDCYHCHLQKGKPTYRLSHIKFHCVIGRRRITIQPSPSSLVQFNM